MSHPACQPLATALPPTPPARGTAPPAGRRSPVVPLGVGLLLSWLSATAAPPATAPTALLIETCADAAASCVGLAESADAWLKPGTDGPALVALVDALTGQRGTGRDTAVHLSCSTGPAPAALLHALRAAGYARVLDAATPDPALPRAAAAIHRTPPDLTRVADLGRHDLAPKQVRHAHARGRR